MSFVANRLLSTYSLLLVFGRFWVPSSSFKGAFEVSSKPSYKRIARYCLLRTVVVWVSIPKSIHAYWAVNLQSFGAQVEMATQQKVL